MTDSTNNPCVYCKNTGFFRDDLSGGQSYCTCEAGKQLHQADIDSLLPPTLIPQPVWKKTDPRHEIYKRADIVILRPSLTGHLEAGMGHVETKNVYCVFTDFENHSLVGEDEKWDEAWLWTRSPKEE